MNVKRAVYIGFLLWIISFVLGMILFSFYGSPTDSGELTNNAPPVAVSYALIVIVVGIASYVYFKKADKKEGWRQGLHLGLIFVGVGTLLDAFTLLILYISGRGVGDLVAYYATPLFFVSVILIVLASMFVGFLRKRIGF
jgi:hypothetical protein